MKKNLKREARKKLDAPRVEKSVLEQLLDFHKLKLKCQDDIKKARRKS